MDQLMREVVDDHMAPRLSAAQRAAAAWHRANGDRERRHTTGVFLKKSRVPGAAPIMGVYVDSHAMAVDFGVNKDLYLARLANIGYEVSGIDFIPSRKGYQAARVGQGRAQQEPVAEELPELTPLEHAQVADLVAGLPESLKPSASKAVELSFRRSKLQRSKKRK